MIDQSQASLVIVLVLGLLLVVHALWFLKGSDDDIAEDDPASDDDSGSDIIVDDVVRESDDEPQDEHAALAGAGSLKETAVSPNDGDDDSTTPSYLIATGLLGVGVVLMAVGVGIWVRPEVVPPELVVWAEQAGRSGDRPFFVLGGIVAALGFVAAVTSRNGQDPILEDIPSPEEVHRPSVQRVGHGIDERLATLDSADVEWQDSENPDGVRAYLRELAVETLVTHNGWERDHAERMVERGEWTDRRDIAAFVGGPDAPEMPIWDALVDWVSAESTVKRRAVRTIQELDAVTEGEDS
ncbi:DUF7269 family protein [Natrinema longum]|uniref:DUF7269 family protein n=1 Tax=Natrinema longum TaxID=370324 RepID=UPI001CCB9E80|nr:hypothetical protein [Natrinema longum]MBZ6496979.1 hypothetical protein [Natrinema longum]